MLPGPPLILIATRLWTTSPFSTSVQVVQVDGSLRSDSAAFSESRIWSRGTTLWPNSASAAASWPASSASSALAGTQAVAMVAVSMTAVTTAARPRRVPIMLPSSSAAD